MTTHGDRVVDRPLTSLGVKGVFTAELEQALMDGRIDVAVHSLKDMPAQLSDSLAIVACMVREDPRDVLITTSGARLAELSIGATLGTSSPRRIVQLSLARPDLHFIEMRGNVDTRLRKLHENPELAGIVLAAAGLHRLGWRERITEYLDPAIVLPAAGQGIVALEVRADRDDVRTWCEAVGDAAALRVALAERGVLETLQLGCEWPLGVLAYTDNASLRIDALLADSSGTQVVRVQECGADPIELGCRAAYSLLAGGGAEILDVRKREL
jgi:hydroxymethylbilane synthase